MTERKIQLPPFGVMKARARYLSFRFLWRLLAAALVLYAFQMILSLVLSFADAAVFGERTAVTLFGTTFSLSFAVLELLALFLTAPVSLGVAAYFQNAARGETGSFGDIFLWIGERKRRRAALSYALFQVAFQAVTFPIRMIPLYIISDRLDMFLYDMQTTLVPDTSILVSREVLMSLVVLLIYELVSLPFFALPYLLADLYPYGFRKSLRYSVKLMLAILPTFLLFSVSFLLWLVAGAFLFFLVIFAAIYFRIAAITLLDQVRAAGARPPYYGEHAPWEGEER